MVSFELLALTPDFRDKTDIELKQTAPFQKKLLVSAKRETSDLLNVQQETQELFAASLQKKLVYTLVFQRNQKFNVIFLVFISYNRKLFLACQCTLVKPGRGKSTVNVDFYLDGFRLEIS